MGSVRVSGLVGSSGLFVTRVYQLNGNINHHQCTRVQCVPVDDQFAPYQTQQELANLPELSFDSAKAKKLSASGGFDPLIPNQGLCPVPYWRLRPLQTAVIGSSHLTCSARTGFRAVTTPLNLDRMTSKYLPRGSGDKLTPTDRRHVVSERLHNHCWPGGHDIRSRMIVYIIIVVALPANAQFTLFGPTIRHAM